MVPLKVVVKGFLTYRDQTELSFAGSKLWMLYGRNGVGKSAIFDAITYALYGEHRGGAQRPELLINQQSDGLEVTFDLQIEDAHYRIHRTVSRKSKSCYVARVISAGPDEQVDIIQGTEMVQRFDEWVRQHIGLDYKAFTASMLLRQGESDRLIMATPAERHEIVGQLIAIDQYEQLYQRAFRRQKDAEGTITARQKDLLRISPVTEDEIAAVNGNLAEAQRRFDGARAALDALLSRQGSVQLWEERNARQRQLHQELANVNAFLVQTNDIEHAHARFQVLERGLSLVRQLLQQRTCLAAAIIAIQELSAKESHLAAEHATAEATLQQTRQQLAQWRQEKAHNERQAHDLQQQREELAPQIREIEQLTTWRKQIEDIDADLSRYPAEIDLLLDDARSAVKAAGDAAKLLAPLSQFSQVRQRWQQALREADRDRATLAALRAQIPDGVTIDQHTQEIDDAYSRCDQRCKDHRLRLEHLTQLDGQVECEYCGQPLTAAHLATERARQQTALVNAQQTLQELGEQKKRAHDLAERIQQIERTLSQREERLSQNQTVALDIYRALPSDVQRRIMASDDITAILQQMSYPTGSDLDELRQSSDHLAAYEQRLNDLMGQRDAVLKLQGQRITIAKQVAGLAERYSDESIEAIQTQARTVAAECTALEVRLASLHAALEADVRHEQQCLESLDRLVRDRQQIGRELASQQAASEIYHQQVQQAEAACPSALGDPTGIDEAQLHVWEQEFHALNAAPARLQQLRDEQIRKEALVSELAHLSCEIEGIAHEARIPLSEYQVQLAEARELFEVAQRDLNDARMANKSLEERLRHRKEIEEELIEAQQCGERWQRIAAILDRNHLQRVLLIQAEVAIVAFANETLASVSDHTLHLESKGESDKAFELVAIDVNAGPEPVGLRFLSGSQRFRVAFSLAMGIGRYLTDGRQTPEAVIIDEGFGSLDQDGRQQMIDEIASLAQQLERIILVSHQDDFAQAFPHAYHIQHDGKTAFARYVVIDDLLMESSQLEPAFSG
jgi:exonuclease SbcC